MTERSLLVSEVFGPTFQGEGPSTGQRAAFLRLAGCNLACTWCDTPYTWDGRRFDLRRESSRMLPEEVLGRLRATAAPLVVVTGGELLLQQDGLLPVTHDLREDGRAVEVETNGTVTPVPALVQGVTRFNVSPKLANSGIAAEKRIRPAALTELQRTGKAVFKFVVGEPDDLREIRALEVTHGLAPIWVMPRGETAEAVLAVMRAVADPVLERGWNLTTRLHVMLWGAARGR